MRTTKSEPIEKCPICHHCETEDNQVFERMDWRQAGRPERQDIGQPVGYAVMCFRCFLEIQDKFAPLAPTFNMKGERNLV